MIIKNIERVKGSDKHVYLIGNGGSAATAIHMACDLVKKCNIKAIALTANIANITAFANDVSYDDAFSEQLRVFLEKGDVVIAISASGESKNVIKAVRLARSKGNMVIALTGFMMGGKLAKLADISLVVKSNSYGVVEDVHMTFNHILSKVLSMQKNTG